MAPTSKLFLVPNSLVVPAGKAQENMLNFSLETTRKRARRGTQGQYRLDSEFTQRSSELLDLGLFDLYSSVKPSTSSIKSSHVYAVATWLAKIRRRPVRQQSTS